MKAYMLEKQKNFFNSLTPEQQKEFIDKRNWYARASEEVKHAHSQKTKDQLASRTKEEQDAINKKNSEGLKKHWQGVSDDDKQQRLQGMREGNTKYWESLSDEEKHEIATRWMNISSEELEKRLQQYSDRMREYNNSLSIDEKRSRARAMMDWHKSLTPEEKKALYYQTHKLHYSADDESYNQYADPRGKFSKIAYHKGSIHGKNSLHIHFEEEFNASNIFRDFYIVPELKVNYVISHHWDYGIYRKKTGELTFLVDLDGDYYHGGDGMDYDGIHSNERWDERRYFSIDPNMKVILHVIPECRFTEGIEELKQYVRLGSYDKIIDHRYKNIKLRPMPAYWYTDQQLINSYLKLIKLEINNKTHKDIWHNGIGEVIIQYFCQSLLNERRSDDISTCDAIRDDIILRDSIEKGMIFNFIDRNKLLQGFNVSDIGRRINIISPGVMKLLMIKYLGSAKNIIDPLNRYSSVFLAGASLKMRMYICNYEPQFHNSLMSISNFLRDNGYVQDVVSVLSNTIAHDGIYDALVTILPDSDDNFWYTDRGAFSPEDFIDQCRALVDANLYLFITDEPGYYENNVVMEITNDVSILKKRYFVILLRQD